MVDGMGNTNKTAIKTAKPSGRNGNVLPVGNHPGNTGGKKGRSGPKTIDFLATCNTLADTLVLDEAKRILALGADGHDEWRWAAEYVSKYTKSEAPKRTVVEGDERKPLTIIVRHE